MQHLLGAFLIIGVCALATLDQMRIAARRNWATPTHRL